MSRKSWQDKRRIRRLAVLLIEGLRLGLDGETLHSAAWLDIWAAHYEAGRPDWPQALTAARHYLREMGRTKV